MENQFWGKFSELIEGAKLVNAFVTLSSLTQQFNFVQQMNGIPPSLGLRIWFHQNGSKLKDPRLAMRYQKMFCFACYRLDFKFGYVVRLWFLCRSLVRTVIQRGQRPGMILNYKAISYNSRLPSYSLRSQSGKPSVTQKQALRSVFFFFLLVNQHKPTRDTHVPQS